jgi:hypothetical protein
MRKIYWRVPQSSTGRVNINPKIIRASEFSEAMRQARARCRPFELAEKPQVGQLKSGVAQSQKDGVVPVELDSIRPDQCEIDQPDPSNQRVRGEWRQRVAIAGPNGPAEGRLKKNLRWPNRIFEPKAPSPRGLVFLGAC